MVLIPRRSSATDNEAIKSAVQQYGGAYVSIGWYGSSGGSQYYNASTGSYYYNGSDSTNHGVLIVGWDDEYSATKFATRPPGNGAFLVKNSWGTSWGLSGYFWASYYDVLFGRGGEMAVMSGAQPVSDYSGIYQYDPLGNCNGYGFNSSTRWFADVFIAQSGQPLSAVGFWAMAPGTTYEVYTGTSLDAKTLATSGTLATMGFHTVRLPNPVALTSGRQFVVFVKVVTPGSTYPIAFEAPYSGYSQAATAAAGQSFVSPTGSTWTDMTSRVSNANVCLKAYVSASAPAPTAPTLTSFSPTSGPVGALVTVNGTGFSGVTRVTFNGTSATFTPVSATQLTATVPSGASSGRIAVTTASGTGTSTASFTVTSITPARLTITGFSPTSGRVGTQVTI